MADVVMRIILSASSGNTGRIIGDVVKTLSSGGLAGVLAGVGLAAGAAAVGVGIASVKIASDFQTSMLSLVAHAGLAQSQFNNVQQAVLNMATEVGRSPVDLANALYPILSGFSGISNQSAKTAISLLTLKDSFKTVAGTTTDGTAVANAAIGTFNALGLATNNTGLNAKRMTALFDVMDKTVQLGNMHWDQYKNVVAKLAIAIQGTGIKFNESQAALALLTNEGFSAQKAATYLNNLFGNMAIKMGALATHAKKLGIAFNEHAYASMNLSDKLKYLDQITGGNKDKMLALLGGSKVALQAFNALKAGAGSYKSNLDTLNHSQGALQASFATAAQGFGFHMQRIKAFAQTLLIHIGNQLLPVLTRLADWFINQGVPALQRFGQWIQANVLPVLQKFGGWIQANVLPILQKFGQWFVSSAVPALQQFGGIIKNQVFPVIQNLVTLIGMALSWIKQHWTQIWNILGPILQGAWDVISGIVKVAWALVSGIIKVGLDILQGHWSQVWTDIKNMLGGVFDGIGTMVHGFVGIFGGAFSALGTLIQGIWDGIVSGIKAAINVIIGLINAFIGGIDSIGIDIGPVHIHPSIPTIPYLARGAIDFAGGLAYVHAGEVLTYLPQHANVYPANRVRAMSSEGGGFGGTTNNFYLNISTMAGSRSEVERMADLIEAEIGRRFRGQTPGYASGGVFG